MQVSRRLAALLRRRAPFFFLNLPLPTTGRMQVRPHRLAQYPDGGLAVSIGGSLPGSPCTSPVLARIAHRGAEPPAVLSHPNQAPQGQNPAPLARANPP